VGVGDAQNSARVATAKTILRIFIILSFGGAIQTDAFGNFMASIMIISREA